MDLGIAGKTAAVAAGSAGLGLACARALLAEGVRVAICGRDPQRLNSAADALGPATVALSADVSEAGEAQRFIAEARERLGAIDILVTNAGGPPPGTFATTSLDGYREAIDLNLMSSIAMCQAAVPAMRERGWGRVIGITSIGVRQPIATLMASSVARAGVTSFMKVLATEVAADGVTVNTVQPGLHATDRLSNLSGEELKGMESAIPAGHFGDPADFGAVVAFLCSRQAGFVTGTTVLVDGGAYPGLL